MEQRHETGIIPQWDQSDRLLKSLRVADMSTGDMAQYLGVTTQTIRNYIDHPKRISMSARRDWSARTGVDFNWLWFDAGNEQTGGTGVYTE